MGEGTKDLTCANCSQFKLVAEMLQTLMTEQSNFIKRTDDKLDNMQSELDGFKAFWLPTVSDPEGGIYSMLRKINYRQDDADLAIADLRKAVDRIEKKTFIGVVSTIASTTSKLIKDAGVVIAALVAAAAWLYAKAKGWLQ